MIQLQDKPGFFAVVPGRALRCTRCGADCDHNARQVIQSTPLLVLGEFCLPCLVTLGWVRDLDDDEDLEELQEDLERLDELLEDDDTN